jgi:Spy/CpxP family protein refolding chaperone
MYRKAINLLLIFSLALNFAFVGVWGYHRFYVRPRMKRIMENRGEDPRFEERLGLEPEQKEKLKQQNREFREAVRKVEQKVQRKRQELFELLQQPNPEEGAIEKCLEEIAQARKQMPRYTVRHMLKLKELLTPEQQRKLMRLMQSRMHRHRPWHERGMRRDAGDERPGRMHGPGRGEHSPRRHR